MDDIFSKFKNGFNKSVTTVSTSSKIMLEKTKTNNYIKAIQQEKMQYIEQLGVKVYDMFWDDNDVILKTEIESICNNINKRVEILNEQLEKLRILDEELNETIKNIKVTELCKECGHINKAEAKFCAKCGKSLNEIE